MRSRRGREVERKRGGEGEEKKRKIEEEEEGKKNEEREVRVKREGFYLRSIVLALRNLGLSSCFWDLSTCIFKRNSRGYSREERKRERKRKKEKEREEYL
jgi:hypothetical protein